MNECTYIIYVYMCTAICCIRINICRRKAYTCAIENVWLSLWHLGTRWKILMPWLWGGCSMLQICFQGTWWHQSKDLPMGSCVPSVLPVRAPAEAPRESTISCSSWHISRQAMCIKAKQHAIMNEWAMTNFTGCHVHILAIQRGHSFSLREESNAAWFYTLRYVKVWWKPLPNR